MTLIDKEELLDLLDEGAKSLNDDIDTEDGKKINVAYYDYFREMINRLPEHETLTGEFVEGLFVGLFIAVLLWACYDTLFVWFF